MNTDSLSPVLSKIINTSIDVEATSMIASKDSKTQTIAAGILGSQKSVLHIPVKGLGSKIALIFREYFCTREFRAYLEAKGGLKELAKKLENTLQNANRVTVTVERGTQYYKYCKDHKVQSKELVGECLKGIVQDLHLSTFKTKSLQKQIDEITALIKKLDLVEVIKDAPTAEKPITPPPTLSTLDYDDEVSDDEGEDDSDDSVAYISDETHEAQEANEAHEANKVTPVSQDAKLQDPKLQVENLQDKTPQIANPAMSEDTVDEDEIIDAIVKEPNQPTHVDQSSLREQAELSEEISPLQRAHTPLFDDTDDEDDTVDQPQKEAPPAFDRTESLITHFQHLDETEDSQVESSDLEETEDLDLIGSNPQELSPPDTAQEEVHQTLFQKAFQNITHAYTTVSEYDHLLVQAVNESLTHSAAFGIAMRSLAYLPRYGPHAIHYEQMHIKVQPTMIQRYASDVLGVALLTAYVINTVSNPLDAKEFIRAVVPPVIGRIAADVIPVYKPQFIGAIKKIDKKSIIGQVIFDILPRYKPQVVGTITTAAAKFLSPTQITTFFGRVAQAVANGFSYFWEYNQT